MPVPLRDPVDIHNYSYRIHIPVAQCKPHNPVTLYNHPHKEQNSSTNSLRCKVRPDVPAHNDPVLHTIRKTCESHIDHMTRIHKESRSDDRKKPSFSVSIPSISSPVVPLSYDLPVIANFPRLFLTSLYSLLCLHHFSCFILKMRLD